MLHYQDHEIIKQIIIHSVCCRFRKRSIENLIRQTEQFVWEECPERDESSGRLTMAGLVPRVQKATVLSFWLMLGPHSLYMLIRGIGSEKLGLAMWTPFDARPSPLHEITIIVQVQAPGVPARSTQT
jgi:hypothetical protein